MSHNEPTTPDYYSSNDTTLVDACYPYNGRTEIPPPPPGTHRIGIRVIILMSVVCIILAGVIGMYTIGSNKETQKSNNNFTTSISTPAIPHTTNPNYTAEDIVKDILRAAHVSLPGSSSGRNELFTIYSWSFDRYKNDVPFTSSSAFADYDMCADGGTCIPPQADKGFTPAQIAIWVYANEKDTSNAYNEIMFQISEGKWAGTPTPAPVGICSVAFMHGRCLMIGATGASIYGQVVTQDCI